MQKSFLCFLVVVVHNMAAPLAAEFSEPSQYSRYIAFPDGEGVMRAVDLEAEPDLELINSIESHPGHNQYSLFTRRNPRAFQGLMINDTLSIIASNFNAMTTTVVIAHGWFSNQFDDVNRTIRDAFLANKDVNVIIMDWSRLSMADYVTATRGVPFTGRHLAQFLFFLNKATGQSFGLMHLVGFSLGAHVVGNAGKALDGRIARITALDPAGPLWKHNVDRIRPSNAYYVEAIHTDGGYQSGSLGIGMNVADADFYANGGTSQPGCHTHRCNHNRAWQLFAASVRYKHLIGRLCNNFIELNHNSCNGPRLHMGTDALRKRGLGVYLVNTYMWYPY